LFYVGNSLLSRLLQHPCDFFHYSRQEKKVTDLILLDLSIQVGKIAL